MRLVVALGGNALLQRGEPTGPATQRGNVARAVEAIADLARQHQVVVTHGNGPQVGLLALQSAAYAPSSPYPLDILGAESEGMIGYLLEQSLDSLLPDRQIATLLTQVEIDPRDSAFAGPTKPIGPVYDEKTARGLASARGWLMVPDGHGWRRAVASPEPLRILELSTIRLLMEAGVLVICAGGGGVPVTVDEEQIVRGAEAVIDKDLSAALLAIGLEAEALLLLTDVDGVMSGWESDDPQLISRAEPASLRALDLAAGSMGPKVEAACRFAEQTGHRAYIGPLHQASAVLAGTAGTLVLAPD